MTDWNELISDVVAGRWKDETTGKTAWSFWNMTGSARRGAIKIGVTLACLAFGAVGWAFKKSKG